MTIARSAAMVLRLTPISGLRLRHYVAFKWIPLFIVATWVLRSVIVSLYCIILHVLIFQWTTCPTENYLPKNFSSVASVVFAQQPAVCAKMGDVDQSAMNILVFVPISVLQFDRRLTIRQTWAKAFIDATAPVNGKRLRTKFLFILGSIPSGSEESGHRLERRLHLEAQTHGDILQLADTVDAYYNITLKIRAVLSWASTACPQAEYIIRADSDISLHYANLMRFLFWLDGSRNSDAVIAGYCRAYDCITRLPSSDTCLPRHVYTTLGRYGNTAQYFVPRYCFGFSYVLSKRFVNEALKVWANADSRLSTELSPEVATVLRSYWPLDDMYLTGYTAEAVGGYVTRLNFPGTFLYQTKFDDIPCHENSVVASAAYEDDDEMIERWKARLETCNRNPLL